MSTFDLHDFNKLPRPDPRDLDRTQNPHDLGTLLRKLVPFLFKPNRALALLGNDRDTGSSWDAQSRWLIRLHCPLEFSCPPCVAVLTRNGLLSVWVYTTHSEQQIGSFTPLYLTSKAQGSKPPQKKYCIELADQDTQSQWATPSKQGFLTFNLLRFVQQCDSEGVLSLRLITPHAEHTLQLDLAALFDVGEGPEIPVLPYVHTPIYRDSASSPEVNPLRQIGGWGKPPAFFRPELHQGQLFTGSARAPQPLSLPKNFPSKTKLWAIVEEDGFMALGGNTDALWVRENSPGAAFRNVRKQAPLQGNVRALEIIPAALHDEKKPLLLAGCDDYHVYVLDHQGRELRGIFMGGPVEAILYLGGAKRAWADLAVLVRNRGIFGVRLFYDQLSFSPGNPYRESFFRAVWRLVELEHTPAGAIISAWLSSQDTHEQLLGLLAILDRPVPEHLALVHPNKLSQYCLHSQVINAFMHRLFRRLTLLLGTAAGHLGELPPRLPAYLQLLAQLAEGPYPSRMALRRYTPQWQNLRQHPLFEKAAENPEYAEYLEKFYGVLPDVKYKICDFTQVVINAHRQGDYARAHEAMITLLGLLELLYLRRLYPKALFRPPEQTASSSGRIDSIGLFSGATDQVVFSQRHHYPLSALRWHAQETLPGPELLPWQPNLREHTNDQLIESAIVRAMLPVPGDPSALLLLMPRKLGITRQEQMDIEWLTTDTEQQPYWSAAFSLNGEYLAVAGEWRHPCKHPVTLFQRDSAGHWHAVKSSMRASRYWHEQRIRITALSWDKQGGLWAASGGKGEVFYWPKALPGGSNAEIYPRLMATTGTPQTAMEILHSADGPLTICGGQDGVVRAFDKEGRLRWANILNGMIQTLTVVDADTGSEYASLAVLTDSEHFFLFNAKGIQCGILHMIRRVFHSLARSKIGSVPHHFLGDLRGEIFIVEELPQTRNDTQLLHHLLADTGIDENELAIIQGYQETLRNSQDFLTACCGLREALNEPLQAAWAARQLMGRYHDFDTVIALLHALKDRFDAASRDLRAHLFDTLGVNFEHIPERLHRKLQRLITLTKDGALASFIHAIPEHVEHNPTLLYRILQQAKTKILEGRPYVSGAVLQRLRRAPSAHPQRTEHFIRSFLRHRGPPTWHPGVLEGLLAVLWDTLGLAQDGLISALARLPTIYPALAKDLREPHKRKLLCEWLDHYGSTLLSTDESRLWQIIEQVTLPAQSADEAQLDTLAADLQRALLRMNKEEKPPGSAKDRQALKTFLALLPPLTMAPQTFTALPAAWQIYATKTHTLRNTLEQIVRQVIPIEDSRDWLNQTLLDLDQNLTQVPLLDNLEAAWRQAWRKVLQRQLELLQLEVSLDHSGNVPPLEEALADFYSFMHKQGFYNERMYHLIEVPGSNCAGVLREHGADNRIPYPIPEKYSSYLNQYTFFSMPLKLLYHIDAPVDGLSSHIEVPFWQMIPTATPQTLRVDVPLLRKRRYGAYFGAYRPFVLFLFDWHEGASQQAAWRAEEALLGRREPLTRLLNQIRRALSALEQEQRQRTQELLDNFNQKLTFSVDFESIENELVKVARELSNAAGSVLLRHKVDQDSLIVRASDGEMQGLYTGCQFHVKDKFWPSVECWQSGKAIFEPDWQTSEWRRKILERARPDQFEPGVYEEIRPYWEQKIGSLAILPILSGNKVVGVIRLHSPHPYLFDAGCIDRLESLFGWVRWFLHALQLHDQRDRERRAWEEAIMHEIRSELMPLNQRLEKALQQPDRAERLIRLALSAAQHLLDLSENFMVLEAPLEAGGESNFNDPGCAVQAFLNLHAEEIQEAKQRIVIVPNTFSAPLWSAERLKGHMAIFARVARNLLHNGLKYGSDDAVIKIEAQIIGRFWQLSVSNQGHMSEQEERLKFTPRARQIVDAKADGAHVGLAASLLCAQIYAAELTVENIRNGNEDWVLARLRWPLAQKDINE